MAQRNAGPFFLGRGVPATFSQFASGRAKPAGGGFVGWVEGLDWLAQSVNSVRKSAESADSASVDVPDEGWVVEFTDQGEMFLGFIHGVSRGCR